MKTFDYSEASVLVTGASRGLGLALVQELARRGARRIYAACRTEEGCAQVRDLHLAQIHPVLLDVADRSQVAQMAGRIGELDLLINNAGIASVGGYASSQALREAEAEIRVHYFGVLALVHALLPLLRKSKQPGIINVSSIAGFCNFKLMGTYSASKAALHFLTQGLRAELKPEGVFVQGVYPGPFDTRLSAGFPGPKPSAPQVAAVMLDAFGERVDEVFPDEFSKSMHEVFLTTPRQLEAIFAEMG